MVHRASRHSSGRPSITLRAIEEVDYKPGYKRTESTNSTASDKADSTRTSTSTLSSSESFRHASMLKINASRHQMRKAARKTMVVIRARHSPQSADTIRIRFNKDRLVPIPKVVKLASVKLSVVEYMNFSSPREKYLVRQLLTGNYKIDDIVTDMFWYLIASHFQQGRHLEAEKAFYDRVANNFTLLFLKMQLQSNATDHRIFDRLPDALSQILFICLSEAFPASRAQMNDGLKKKIIESCYLWFVGFVPSKISYSHWLPQADSQKPQNSTNQVAFPALYNRKLCQERLERIKEAEMVKHRDRVQLEQSRRSEKVDGAEIGMPDVPMKVESHERALYTITNSPLINKFLQSRNVPERGNGVKLRLTNDSSNRLEQQLALQRTPGTVQRRKRILDAKSYNELLTQFEKFGASLRNSQKTTTAQVQVGIRHDRSKLGHETAEIQKKMQNATKNEQKVHEMSNVLVCKRRLEDLRNRGREGAAPVRPAIENTEIPPRRRIVR